MTSEKEQVFSEIRACIISSQGGVAATELNRDYKCLVGESIPYRRLGYSSLEAFLNEVPNVHVFQNKGEWWLEAKASGASHIQKLVQGQNKSKPRKPKRNFKFTPRSSAGQFTPKKSYSQVPHFMQTKTSFKPSPKPKTQYIPPSQNSDFSRNVPTKVISGKQASAKQSNNVPDNKSKPKPLTHMHHEIQSTGPLLSTQTQTTSRKSPLLPTPTTQRSPANPTLLKQPDLTPLTPSGSNGLKSPAQTDFRKPQKSSVSSRLQAFKKKSPLDSLAESLGEIRMKSPTGQNGHIESREKARKVPKSQIPPKSVPVKFVQPIQHKNNQNTSKKGKLSNDMRYFPESAYDDSSYVIKLQRYAQERMLPQPEFFVLSRRIKKAGKLAFIYLGRISWVGPPDPSMPPNSVHEFSSYPAEFDDSRLAIEAVAKKAYTSLVESCSIQLPETSDPEVVIERVKQMIVGQPQGVWLFKIEREYMERYNEVLPKNFPELAMQHCRDIDVNTFAGIYSIVRLKDEMLPDRISQIIDRVHLPKDDTWDVFVSKVKSLNEIYVRLLHDRAAGPFESMWVEMDEYYVNNPGKPLENIQLGSYYAFVTSQETFRCFVTGQLEEKYQVYLIDVGDVEIVTADALRELSPKFYDPPAQAVPCYLEGLDNFDFALTVNNAELTNKVIELILGRSMASIVTFREPVRLYLVDTEKDDDVNMNEVLKDMAKQSFTDPRTSVKAVGAVINVNVPIIDSSGRVFIQKPSWTLDCLNDKLSAISNGSFKIVRLGPENVTCNKLYCHNGSPTRVLVKEILSNETLIGECVDTGGAMEMAFEDLFDVPELDDILPFIPHQAVQVLLNDFNEGTLSPIQAKKCMEIFNANEQTICKTTGHSPSGVPIVELFVRNQETRLLTSLNQSIILCDGFEDDSYGFDDDESSVCGISSVATSMTTSVADLSIFSDLSVARSEFIAKGPINFKINEELEIFVTRVANPQNFTVIPVKYLKALNLLMDEMNMFFGGTSPSNLFHPALGDVVAGFSAGRWFRVLVHMKLDSDCYSGKFLDQGHMEMFPCKALRPLPDKFKKIPYLAFRGQLHGIMPANGKDWEVDDCVRLKELIHDKKLYSIIRDIPSDQDGKTLSLEIVDTSSDTDIYISRLFVYEQRAVAVLL